MEQLHERRKGIGLAPMESKLWWWSSRDLRWQIFQMRPLRYQEEMAYACTKASFWNEFSAMLVWRKIFFSETVMWLSLQFVAISPESLVTFCCWLQAIRWAESRIHPGQVTSPPQGKHRDKQNNQPFNLEYPISLTCMYFLRNPHMHANSPQKSHCWVWTGNLPAMTQGSSLSSMWGFGIRPRTYNQEFLMRYNTSLIIYFVWTHFHSLFCLAWAS